MGLSLKMSESNKPYFTMVCLQFGYAGMNLITKLVLDHGMSHFVLVSYRNAFATATIAPFALLSQRKLRPKMTFSIFIQVFVLALLGPVIDQNLYYTGLKLTSPTFSGAVTSILPTLTFIISIICRMEKVEIRKVRFQVKVVGTLIIVVGAIFIIFFKALTDDCLKAIVFLLLASFSWSCFFVLQAVTLKRYSCHVSLSTMVCFIGTLQSIAVTYVMEPNPSSAWNIGFDMNLLASVYAGVMSSSIAYYVQGLMTKEKSPVFVTAFHPLVVIIVSIIGYLILGQSLYFSGIIGMVMLILGVFAVLWGQEDEVEDENFVEVFKCCNGDGDTGRDTSVTVEDDDLEMQSAGKAKTATMVVVVVNEL